MTICRHSSLVVYSGKFRPVLREELERSTRDDLEGPLFPYHRLPKLSLVALSSLERRDIQVQTEYTGRRVTNSEEYQILDMRKFTFLLKVFFMVDVRFELTTSS